MPSAPATETLARVAMTGARPWPPRVSAFTKPFWDGLVAGRFSTVRCRACEKRTFPPKPFCPHCWARGMDWVPLAPRGTVYASTVVHAAPKLFAHEIPYRVCIVDLEDGLRIATRLVGAQDFAVDRAVELVVLDYEDGPLYAARPLG